MSSKQELFCASLGIFLIIFAALVSETNASQAIMLAKKDPNNPGNCIFDNENHKVGKTQIKGECALIDCAADCFCSISGCGAVGVRPPCYLIQEKEKSYPDCCPQPVCPEENSLR